MYLARSMSGAALVPTTPATRPRPQPAVHNTPTVPATRAAVPITRASAAAKQGADRAIPPRVSVSTSQGYRTYGRDQVGDSRPFMEVDIRRNSLLNLEQYQQVPAELPKVATTSAGSHRPLRLRSSKSIELERERQARLYGVDREFRRRDREQMAEDRSRSGTAPPMTEAGSSSSGSDTAEDETEEESAPKETKKKGKGKEKGKGKGKGKGKEKGN